MGLLLLWGGGSSPGEQSSAAIQGSPGFGQNVLEGIDWPGWPPSHRVSGAALASGAPTVKQELSVLTRSSTPELELSSPQPENPRLQWPRRRASGAGEGCPSLLSGPGTAADPEWGTSATPPRIGGFSKGQVGKVLPSHNLRGRFPPRPPPPAWGTSHEEKGIKENIPQVFLQKCFCIWSLGEFSCLLKGERRLVLKPRLLFLAGATCPAKSLGLVFPILGVLALKGLPSPPPPPPPGAQLTAGGGSFHLGPQPGFERARGPYLPGHAQLPAREALPGRIQ